MTGKLNIAVMEEDPDRARMIVDGLRDTGGHEITVIGDVSSLARRLAALAERSTNIATGRSQGAEPSVSASSTSRSGLSRSRAPRPATTGTCARRSRPGSAAELVAAPQHFDVAAEILERTLSGRLMVDGGGREVRVARAIEFFAGAASFPWRSQALWIAEWLARSTGADRGRLRAAARSAFRAGTSSKSTRTPRSR